MVLEELHELIETLQLRIDVHGPALQQSEALTRYALIDPLLRGLGWDTGDPSQVLVEFRSQNGAADYALLGASGQPHVIVEAKKLGTQLQAAVGQVINYCIHDGFEYFAVTDGQHWELYETNRPGPLADRMAMQLNLMDEAADTCLRSLSLWRRSMESGQIRSGSRPIVEVTTTPFMEPEDAEATPSSEAKPIRASGQSAPRRKRPVIDRAVGFRPLTEDHQQWTPLSTLDPGTGNKPAAIRLPTGQIETVSSWKDLGVTIPQWLCSNDQLHAHHLPVRASGGRRTIAASSHFGSDGKKLFVKSKELNASFPIHVEINMSARDMVASAKRIISHVGLNPGDFAVRLQ